MTFRHKPILLGSAMVWLYPAWVCLACTLIFAQLKGQLFTGSRSMLAAGLFLLALGSALALKSWMSKPRSKTEWLLLGILCAAFVIRLFNVLYTPVNVRQHDVAPFGQTEPIRQFCSYGHAEYIEWICRYLRLPEVSPLNYQLYHPPLHHLIAGLWLRLNLTAGMAYRRACESIQFLTLYYSFGTVLAGKKLFEQLGLKKGGLIAATALLAFHPALIWLSSSVNNDALCVFLVSLSLLAALKWYQKPSTAHVALTGLALGLAMMAKLSGALAAFPIAVLFLCRWIRAIRLSQKNTLPYLRQFLLFTLICVPLGLWWQVKNAVVYGVPLTYVPAAEIGDISGYAPWQRLLDFGGQSLGRVFVLTGPEPFFEYRIPIAILKSSLFDEHQLFSAGSAGFALCGGLLAVNAALIVASLAAMLVFAIRKRRFVDGPVTAALYVYWGATLLQYLKFCLDYPHTCSMTFRYITPILLCSCLFLGYAVSALDENGRWCTIIAWVLRGLCGVFCALSCGMFLLLGLA